jgi:ribosomal protein S12 methylthiotransferase
MFERYRPDLEKIPNVDQYFGTTELPALLKALGADYKHELLGERLTTTPKLCLSKIRRLRQTL